MMKKKPWQRYLVASLIVSSLVSGWLLAQKKSPLKPGVQIVPATVRPGEKAELKVTLNLSSGMHINSYKPEDEFAIATELKVGEVPGLVLELPRYPSGKKHTYSYAPEGLTVYEGYVAIVLPLQVKKETKPGRYSIKGQLKWQPCDANVCYPPEKADIVALIHVK
ncbi:MAG: hypothetical protein HYR55_06970 [Acidobacteria bacterium]|nr:hypothetical protein [Acidobacteriota bacterium]MBI3656220.1 hypothetical protein [Acidobacteriota bacterium]